MCILLERLGGRSYQIVMIRGLSEDFSEDKAFSSQGAKFLFKFELKPSVHYRLWENYLYLVPHMKNYVLSIFILNLSFFLFFDVFFLLLHIHFLFIISDLIAITFSFPYLPIFFLSVFLINLIFIFSCLS